MDRITRNWPELQTAIPQSRLSCPDGCYLLCSLEKRMRFIECIGFSPQCFPHTLQLVAAAEKPLFGAVIQAGNAQQCEQAADPDDHLVIIFMRIIRVDKQEPVILVVVIQEGD